MAYRTPLRNPDGSYYLNGQTYSSYRYLPQWVKDNMRSSSRGGGRSYGKSSARSYGKSRRYGRNW